MEALNKYTLQPLDRAGRIRQSILEILTTQVATRIKRREFGSLTTSLLDSAINPAMLTQLYGFTAEAIARWEPDVQVLGFDGRIDSSAPNTVLVTVYCFDNQEGGAYVLEDLPVTAPTIIPAADIKLDTRKELDLLRGQAALQFRRASKASYLSMGIITRAAADTPRFETQGLLIEPEAINYCHSSLDQAWEEVGRLLLKKGLRGPDGRDLAVLVTAMTTIDRYRYWLDVDVIQEAMAPRDEVLVTASICVKPAGVNTLVFGVRNHEVVAEKVMAVDVEQSLTLTFNDQGDIAELTHDAINAGHTALANGWHRIWLTLSGDVLAEKVEMFVAPAKPVDKKVGGGICCDMGQLEIGAVMTSVIDSDGETQRSADLLTLEAAELPECIQGASCWLAFERLPGSGNNGLFLINHNTLPPLMASCNSADELALSAGYAVAGGCIDRNTSAHIGLSYQAAFEPNKIGMLRGYIEGCQIAEKQPPHTMVIDEPNHSHPIIFSIGRDGTGGTLCGHLKQFRYWSVYLEAHAMGRIR